jgi:hypothetical protein
MRARKHEQWVRAESAFDLLARQAPRTLLES